MCSDFPNFWALFYFVSGSCARVHETDVDIAVLDPDKSMVVEMVVDGKQKVEGAPAVFQCALMYTRSDGIRALRIHTVALPTTAKLPEVNVCVLLFAPKLSAVLVSRAFRFFVLPMAMLSLCSLPSAPSPMSRSRVLTLPIR